MAGVDFYTTSDVMRLLGLTKGGVHSLVRRGQLRPVNKGRRGGDSNQYCKQEIHAAALLMTAGFPAVAAVKMASQGHQNAAAAAMRAALVALNTLSFKEPTP